MSQQVSACGLHAATAIQAAIQAPRPTVISRGKSNGGKGGTRECGALCAEDPAAPFTAVPVTTDAQPGRGDGGHHGTGSGGTTLVGNDAAAAGLTLSRGRSGKHTGSPH